MPPPFTFPPIAPGGDTPIVVPEVTDETEEAQTVEFLDVYATAIANGYSHGQAVACTKDSLKTFVIFTTEIIRPDGKPVELVYKTARVSLYAPIFTREDVKKTIEELENRLKQKQAPIWRKCNWGEGEICLAEKLPELKVALMSQPKIEDAQFKYTLCGKENKWIKRFPISYDK